MPSSVAELSPVTDAPAQLSPEAVLGSVKQIVEKDLVPLVHAIDTEGLYPEAVMKSLGAAGAFGLHVPGIPSGTPDLWNAIQAMSIAGEHCLSTSFCMWCQDALAWYVFASANEGLKRRIGEKVAAGKVLGGTGLSNPMKAIFGIERMRLRGRRIEGGYEVKGLLPWVSNLGEDHFFGAMFETEGEPSKRVMAVVDCAGPGVKITQNDDFVALDGTRTYSVQLRDAFISDDMILADPIDAYLPRIRCGFILLQAGMAFGIMRGCIKLMRQARASLSHVNCYLDKQPEDFEAELTGLERTVRQLCETPFSMEKDYFRRVVEARLAAGEASVAAAHFAMLHQGARGYVAKGAAQRRLREAYFVAIVTPATKQLKKMLADMSA
ncbi:MAG TPA: acyl-CoA dehydrogenase family protein [Hyphomicrobiaceae bacterium]|nr:acyl-CoA dehydrogenase family protein [Hyphomicrobiaceae bacterium]